MIVIQYLVLAVLGALAWMVLSAQVNLEGFILGVVLALPVVAIVGRGRRLALNPLRLPLQIAFLLIYLVVLAWDIFGSGIDVVMRILGLRPINPGIVRMSVQDDNEIIKALTAHGITITPGQLVVDFDEDDIVYVHNLDIAAAEKLDTQQARRLRHLRRIVGR